MYKPKYALFFDNHTQQCCTNVGHGFNAENFADDIQRIGADLVGFHAKCNQGFCYYDTKIGNRHPSLQKGHDLFGDVFNALSKRNIKVCAYFNCGLSNEDGVMHPEWCKVTPDDKIFHKYVLDSDITPYLRIMCINSPYRDYLLSLIREVKEKYPVAGFLLDSFNAFPCVCKHCVEGMRKLGMDPKDPEDQAKFAQLSDERLAKDISEIVQPRRDGLMMFCLGLSPRDNLKYGSYLECECLPTVPCWGYDWLPAKSRYFRTLTQNNESILNMTGRFYNWGDFGSLRTDAAIEYDLFFGLANGMRPNIGDHFIPDGTYYRGIVNSLSRIYGKLKQYDPWFDDAKNPVDMAVVLPEMTVNETSKAVIRMLSELNMQFDLIDSENDWSKYDLLVLPDYVNVDDVIREKLAVHFKKGGKIIATGTSGLDVDGTHFVFEKEWGVSFKAEKTFNPCYFCMTENYKDVTPELPLTPNADCIEAEALPGTIEAAKLVAPYYDKGFDGIYSCFYTPPAAPTELPFITMTKQVAYCSGKLFSGYFKAASVELRSLFKMMIDHLLAEPMLLTGEKFPSFARAFVSEQPSRKMVHLLNYIPELRGEMLIVEEALEAYNIPVKLRLDGQKVKKVYSCPDREEIDFVIDGNYVTFTVPYFKGYSMTAVEFE
ncbi:MAG: beta-galactosidase trimerization domain-containing protein [Lentisphaeria bacterium]|nr:beta-galactosidase trimerization domain-containing protein [Lentisphaeria bacterium]